MPSGKNIFWMQETGPVADNGMCACQQRDTDCFTLKSDEHGLENGICVREDSVICHRNETSEQDTNLKVAIPVLSLIILRYHVLVAND